MRLSSPSNRPEAATAWRCEAQQVNIPSPFLSMIPTRTHVRMHARGNSLSGLSSAKGTAGGQLLGERQERQRSSARREGAAWTTSVPPHPDCSGAQGSCF